MNTKNNGHGLPQNAGILVHKWKWVFHQLEQRQLAIRAALFEVAVQNDAAFALIRTPAILPAMTNQTNGEVVKPQLERVCANWMFEVCSI